MRLYRTASKRRLLIAASGVYERLHWGRSAIIVTIGLLTIYILLLLSRTHRPKRVINMNFEYDRELLSSSAGLPQLELDNLSSFDNTMMEQWDVAMHKGYFRYKLGELRYRQLPGKQALVALSNRARGTLRRPPESMCHINQPFNPDKFHFGLIKADKEVLLKMKPFFRWFSASSHADHEPNNDIIINDSPIERGHILMVPHRTATEASPQSATEYGVRYAVDLLLLSQHRHWLVLFNSLCALASVNHLHFHALYSNEALASQTWPAVNVCNSLYRLDDNYHSFAFVVGWRQSSEQLALDIMRVIKVLVGNNVAHNMVIMRGPDPSAALYPGLLVPKALIFPRKHFVGAKQQSVHFNVAALELAGLLLHYGSQEEFEHLTEQEALETLKAAQLDAATLKQLTDEAVQEFAV